MTSIHDMSEYLGVFLDESDEQLEQLESNILELEREDSSPDRIQTLFRAAHTLKGASRAMGFTTIGSLTHEMENILDGLRKDELKLSHEIVEALFQCLDTLRSLLNIVRETGADGKADATTDLISKLSLLRSGQLAPIASAVVKGQSTTRTSPQTAGFEQWLGVIDESKLGELESEVVAGNSVLDVIVTLRDDCQLKSVRVLMVLGAIEGIARVMGSLPGQRELENEEFGSAFQLLICTHAEPDEVAETIGRVSEIANVTATILAAAPIALPSKVPAPAAAPALCFQPAENRETEPARPALEPKPAPGTHGGQSSTVRVDVARLDNMLNLVGEMVIDRTQLAQLGDSLRTRYSHDDEVALLADNIHRLTRITGEMQTEIMQTRLMPIDGILQRFPRMVRDLAQKTSKLIDFQMLGGETELDRTILESLGDPIIHLLRNSVDHGVELPEVREACGKPRTGKVVLSASHQEGYVVIEVSDDGRGIDIDSVKKSSIENCAITEAQAARMTDKDALSLIFSSGVSTANSVSEISGRGVGMDIVRSSIAKLGGQIVIESEMGIGTKFVVRLPLTLAIMRALVVMAAGGTYVLPLNNVVELLRLGSHEGATVLRSVQQHATIVVRGRTVPLISLEGLLCDSPDATATESIPEDSYVVVVGIAEQQVGLAVDRLIGQQEAVVKSLGVFLGSVPGVAGATILGDGAVALILDAGRAIERVQTLNLLTQAARHHKSTTSFKEGAEIHEAV